MISLDKCNGSYNVVDDLSTKICVPNETKSVNAKAINMITRIKLKIFVMINMISKYKFDSPTCISNQKWNNDKCQCECKKYQIMQKRLQLES